MPDLKKAELIEGEVYVASPVRHRRHSQPHGQLMTWIGNYAASTLGVEFGDNGSIRLDLDNELQPDAYLMIAPEHGGQARISEEDQAHPSTRTSRLACAAAEEPVHAIDGPNRFTA